MMSRAKGSMSRSVKRKILSDNMEKIEKIGVHTHIFGWNIREIYAFKVVQK